MANMAQVATAEELTAEPVAVGLSAERQGRAAQHDRLGAQEVHGGSRVQVTFCYTGTIREVTFRKVC